MSEPSDIPRQDGVRSASSRGQPSPAPSMCAGFFVALYRPGPLTVGANSSDNFLPSLVQTAP